MFYLAQFVNMLVYPYIYFTYIAYRAHIFNLLELTGVILPNIHELTRLIFWVSSI